MKNNGPMLNAYPDSLGGTLSDLVSFLEKDELKNTFQSIYLLPSIFNTDLDRGFSVIDYSLNQVLASQADLDAIKKLGIDLKLDFILNHASVLSPQFQDILEHGEASKYRDFFIDWNEFWKGFGKMTEDGYIQPGAELIQDMFFRKPGLPILMVRFPDGSNVPYWNTFYQEVRYPTIDAQDVMRLTQLQYGLSDAIAKYTNETMAQGEKATNLSFEHLFRTEDSKAAATVKDAIVNYLEENRKYLGQMDLNVKSPLVWEFYEDTLKKLSDYGAKIVRLDAFAYASKEVGEKNFLNEPGTWDILQRLHDLAERYHLKLLPEIHASYDKKNYEQISEKGYMTYDFFLPGLILDGLEYGTSEYLAAWAKELIEKKIQVVNMLGCHDGIPLLDLKGMLPEERIQSIIDTVVKRGGYVKNLHGQKNLYYQVNATYYSALGEDDRKMLLARAIQLFMPGKPQIWYLDLFAGKNDHEAVKRAGAGGHKEINRTNLNVTQMEEGLTAPIVLKQLDLLRFRATNPAFDSEADIQVQSNGPKLMITWNYEGYSACLNSNLETFFYSIVTTTPDDVQKALFTQA